ncbi:MAG TPA: PadR family transcriptional regulator [Bryobacteraceae bacterium]|jgi:DNA-binding PadR family transcriptional regulator
MAGPWGWWSDPNAWNSWFYTPLRRGRFFGASELRLAILSMLEEKPKHGYELMKELESRSGGSYRVSAGTMYPSLQMLEDEGMVTSEQLDGRRVYTLTDLGKAEVEKERAAIDRIWQKASHWGDWGPWVAGPIAALMKATFHAVTRAANDREKKATIERVLDQARRDLESL